MLARSVVRTTSISSWIVTVFSNHADQKRHGHSTHSADATSITPTGATALRIFQKPNVTRRIATIGVLAASMVASIDARVEGQESNSDRNNAPLADVRKRASTESDDDVTLEKFGPPKLQAADMNDDDKWALTDEDRMTDEEMDDELFGSGSLADKTAETEDAEEQKAASDEDDDLAPGKDDQPSEKNAQRLAPRQTIESYLKNISTLTIETRTVEPDSLDGVDMPVRKMPPQVIQTPRLQAAARLRFQTPDIYHQPLYFEDQSLERQGVHRCRRQPIESARKFLSTSISLPYKLRQQRPGSCVHRENHRYSQPSLLPPIH